MEPEERLKRHISRASGTSSLVVALFLLGSGLAWILMPTGAWLGNDSITYLGVARNLAAGDGLTSPFTDELSNIPPNDQVAAIGKQPVTVWPPGYPAALAAGSPAGLSPEAASRLVDAAALGICLVATALFARRLGGMLAAAMAGGMIGASAPQLVTFTSVGSDPLYIALQSAGLLVLALLVRGVTWPRLIAYVILAAAASLTRMVGVSVILVGAVTLAIAAPLPQRRCLAVSGSSTMAALLPLLLWVASTARVPGWRGGLAPEGQWSHGTEVARSIGAWFVPHRDLTDARLPAVLALIAVGCAIAGAGYWFSLHVSAGPLDNDADAAPMDDRDRDRPPTAGPLLGILLGHAGPYLLIVLLAATFIDHQLPEAASRLLAPIAPSMIAVLVGGIAAGVRLTRPGLHRASTSFAAVLVGAALIIVNGMYSYDAVYVEPLAGIWSEQEEPAVVDALATLDADAPVFTNWPSAIYGWTGRPALALPLEHYPLTGRSSPRYLVDLDQLATIMCSQSAVIVVRHANQSGSGTVRDLKSRIDLVESYRDEDFSVLQCGSTADLGDRRTAHPNHYHSAT